MIPLSILYRQRHAQSPIPFPQQPHPKPALDRGDAARGRDPPVLAAALADASPEALERLLAEDASFSELILACRALRDLPDDAWLERMRHLVRERRVLTEVEAARQRPPAAGPRPGARASSW